MNQHLIVGCGYLGHRVARRWLAQGLDVSAITRRADRAGELKGQGIEPIIADVTDTASLVGLPACDVILYAVGFDRTAGKGIEEVYVSGLANVLDALPVPPRRFIYISSTGVYGQTDGSWVDETSPCQPTRPGGRACLAAEELLTASPFADQSVILRCAGLYGPGRIPRLADVERRQPIAANPDVYLNLIHIDDVAGIVECVGGDSRRPVGGDSCRRLSPLYTVSDGHPVLRRDFYNELAALLNLPQPTFNTPGEAVGNRRAGGDNKRVSNSRMTSELNVTLQCPTYCEGLASIVAGN